ncbi:neprilysin-2-like [Oppia nitens]|uniref:neprilysin-2-like n=1 Tax=Oppia nitens TaxID=1686743 RepID=UPI0023DC738C|nr:neprilysin-2-like [Oppia nitens]
MYEFTCGQWIKNSLIPDNRIGISTAGNLVETIEFQFKELLEERPKPDDLKVFNNIRKLYFSCLNISQLIQIGDGPLIEILLELGGWPIIEEQLWKEKQFNWIETNMKMREMGLPFNQFYHLSVGLDLKNNTKHIITIAEIIPGVGDRNVMLNGMNDPNVRAYYDLLVECAILLGVKQTNGNPFNQIKDLIDFQIKIISLTKPMEETRNVTKLYNKMTVKELQVLAPNTPWLQLLSAIFGQTIHLNDEIVVNNPYYVKQVDHLINITNKRILANHMLADIVLTSLSLLHPKWFQLNEMYLNRITGRQSIPPRWQTCVKSAASLSVAFSALYVRKYFAKESKQKAKEMVYFIHKKFIEMFDDIEWMDQLTRERAIQKATAITSYIGFPDQLLNDSQIANIYQNLDDFDDSQYFQNTLKMMKWLTNYSHKDLRESRNKGNWQNFADTAVVNAYYSAVENAIIFPAGILQGIFFNYHNPNYLNFGAIGTVIAHEITHAFDDIGKQFDQNGNNNNWWDSRTDSLFNNKSQCLINQYNNYVLPEIEVNINGMKTLGENIADNVGVREAFRAYKTYISTRGPELTLPGLKYTPEQLFWITYGNIWCTKTRPEMTKMIISEETHCPSRFRVIGTVSNLIEFANSFNCSNGSPMNPVNKCRIW